MWKVQALESIRRIFRTAWGEVRRFGAIIIRPRRWGLLGAIVFWVILAIAAFTALGWMWGSGPYLSLHRIFVNWVGGELRTEPFERIKVSLTMIGGIGAVGYLVIKYRERAGVEHNEANARLLSAVQQLGSDSPQVRIAGVYSLADLADTYGSSYHQRVVDILCGYLRVERGCWNSPDGAEVRSREVKEVSEAYYTTNDGPVESTILNVLARHLRKERIDSYSCRQVKQDVADDQLWCDCEIDLHGVHFTERVHLWGITCRWLNASGAQFHNYLNLGMSTFVESASFHGALFSDEAWFKGARFRAFANFNKATFRGYVTFSRALFAGDARFRGIKFERGGSGNFGGARFNVEYWHTDPPIFLVEPPSEFILELPSGASWADFSSEPALEIDEPEVWCRKNRGREKLRE